MKRYKRRVGAVFGEILFPKLWTAVESLKTQPPFFPNCSPPGRARKISGSADSFRGPCVCVRVWMCVCVCARVWGGLTRRNPANESTSRGKPKFCLMKSRCPSNSEPPLNIAPSSPFRFSAPEGGGGGLLSFLSPPPGDTQNVKRRVQSLVQLT